MIRALLLFAVSVFICISYVSAAIVTGIYVAVTYACENPVVAGSAVWTAFAVGITIIGTFAWLNVKNPPKTFSEVIEELKGLE